MSPEVSTLLAAMEREGYIGDATLATALHLAQAMRRPLLVEGEAGVGKTEIAKVLARILDTELIRLQCYEGLDASTALYEWDYQRQLLRLRMAESEARSEGASHDEDRSQSRGQDGNDTRHPAASHGDRRDGRGLEHLLFSRAYLLERPLLRAITRTEGAPVLLVDEIDRADDGFEAFLLELLSDFQVTIPELGTLRAVHPPHVILTSNRTRELGDALRRRCLYLHVDHPDLDKEVRILRRRVPEIDARLARSIAGFVHELRRRPLAKTPGVAETLDWARALLVLHRDAIDAATVEQTLGCLLKDRDDVAALGPAEVAALLAAGERAAELAAGASP